jgi:prolyl-tRNA synthetase
MAQDSQREVALDIYGKMQKKKMEVLLDDRDERVGVKFNDADLIGLPLRINIGEKSLKQGNVEIRIRKTKEIIPVKKEDAVEKCEKVLKQIK